MSIFSYSTKRKTKSFQYLHNGYRIYMLKTFNISSFSSSSNICSEHRLKLSYTCHQPVVSTTISGRVNGNPYSSSSRKHSSCSPLLILHGLFGSKQNWRSLAKGFSQRLNTKVYTLDLRNHGDSPHHSRMDYESMSQDIVQFIEDHRLGKVNLMGHSMGGKVAMHLSLMNPSCLDKLVVVDMAPVDQSKRISSEFQQYIKWMKWIRDLNVKSTKEANDLLMEKIKNQDIVSFLLTNLKENKSTEMNPRFQWRIHLEGIEQNLQGLWTFASVEHSSDSFHRPVLFVAGTLANYLTRDMYPGIQKLFPRAQFHEIHAGHWVHAEQPKHFTDAVVKFLLSSH